MTNISYNMKQNLINLLKWAENMSALKGKVRIAGDMRYMLFVTALGIAYIANTHYAERQMRDISRLQKDIKELHWQYTATQSQLMQSSKQTEVAKLVAPLGLKELSEPPAKILIPSKN